MQDADKEGAVWGQGGSIEELYFMVSFYKPTTALKNEAY